MPLPRGLLVPFCVEIGSSVFKISCSRIWQRTDERIALSVDLDWRRTYKHYSKCVHVCVMMLFVVVLLDTAKSESLNWITYSSGDEDVVGRRGVSNAPFYALYDRKVERGKPLYLCFCCPASYITRARCDDCRLFAVRPVVTSRKLNKIDLF